MQKFIEKFEDVISYFEHYREFGNSPDIYSGKTYRLDRMQTLLEYIGNPQENFKAIHIAGSKGKGSTATMLAKAIQVLGYKCGLYTSPHVVDYRERFTIAGIFFEDNFLIQTGKFFIELLDKLDNSAFPGGEKPTVFELFTAYSYLLFKNSGCEYAVIETGMGGRLDSTNTLKPIACILTPIELEHTAILGDTISKIATEKSKIIKKGTPCFISFQKPEAEKVFLNEASINNSPYFLLKNSVKNMDTSVKNKKQWVKILWQDGSVTELNMNMLGRVQAENAALTLLVLKTLNLYSEGISEKAIEETTLTGRFQQINANPPLYIDGAHTVSSVANLLSTFSELYPNRENTVIFGCLPDKKIDEISDLIIENFDNIIISKPGDLKPNNPEEIFKLFKSKLHDNDKKRVILIENGSDALIYALRTTPENCAILATGSFYLAGKINNAVTQTIKKETLSKPHS